MTDPALQVLLVEDNAGDAVLLEKALRDAEAGPFAVTTVETVAEALDALQNGKGAGAPEVVLLDLSLPDSHGIETFQVVHRAAPRLPVLVLTGLDDEALAMQTVHAGAQDYLVKGDLTPRALVRAIRYAVERHRAEEALRESERRFRVIFNSSFQFMCLVSPEGRLLEVNHTALDFADERPEQMVGGPIWDTSCWNHTPETRERVRAAVREAASGRLVRYEERVLGAGDRLATIDFTLKPMFDAQGRVTLLIAEGHDITARKQADEERARLLASEQEKSEQLALAVREAHHRIKNNLQAISDLLTLARNDPVTPPDEALRQSIERVQAIALVHDLLSQNEDVRSVDTKALIERLVPNVLASNRVGAEPLEVRVAVVSARLSSKRATALALIVNELVSNATKYAVRGREQGEVSITLTEDCEDLVLRVEDNGPGLPEGFHLDRDAHVGLQVVRILAERDLGGALSLQNRGGLLAEVRIPW